MKIMRLVTFDATGTLLTFRKPIGQIYADAAKRFQLNVDPDVINREVSKHISLMSKQHLNFGRQSGLGWRNWWKIVVSNIFEVAMKDCSFLLQPNAIESLSEHLIDSFATKDVWKLTDGSIDTLKYIQDKSIQLGVISNFDPRLHNILTELNINKFFNFVLTSYEAGFSKPDTNIFKEAENAYTALGHKFDKHLALHVGDSFKLDYCGAKNAGWNAVLIKTIPKNKYKDLLVFKNLIVFKDEYLRRNIF